MPEEKPHHGGVPIRGDDTHSIAQDEHSGKIPTGDIVALEQELYRLRHGSASLTIAVRDGKYQYSWLSREFTRIGDGNGE